MNIRITLLYLCLTLSCFKAGAQSLNNNIKLLQKRISIASNDTNKVLLSIALSDSLVKLNAINEAAVVSQKTYLLVNKLNYPHGIVLSIMQLPAINELKKNYAGAITYYKQAIAISEAHHIYADMHLAYGCILNMYYYLGDYPSAMTIAQKGIGLAEQQNDKEKLANYDNQLGFIYLKQEKPSESKNYYQQYLKLATQLNNPMILANCYTSLADVYLLEKDYKTALHYLFNALNIYKKSNLYTSSKISYTVFEISNIYKLQGHYQQALQYALNGLSYHDPNRPPSYNLYDLAGYYINIGEIYTALKNYTEAMQFLNKGLSLSKSIQHQEDIRDAYNGLSKTYALQNRYDSAYHYQELYAALKDSIINVKTTRAIEQIRSVFENDKKDKEIALLSQGQKLKATESEKKSLVLNIVVIFFTLLAVISYLILYIRNSKKQQRLDNEKQLAVQTERLRISGDMHDDIGTGLSTMLLYVNMLKSKLSGKVEYPDAERLALLGTEVVAQMHEIVWSLNPGNDSLENLLIFIRQYFVQLFEPIDYRTNIVFPDSIPHMAVKGIIRRNVYLCVKESLNNIIKHANTNWVELNIQLQQNKLSISIKDNGMGFPDNSGGKFFSNGLKNMQRRMEQINGKFKYYNEDGARINIEIELQGVPKRVVA